MNAQENTKSVVELMGNTEVSATTSSKFYFIDPRNIVIVTEGSESNVRQESDYGDIDSLMNDIIQNGLAMPLIVRKIKGEEKYQLIEGHRRFRAITKAISLGHEFKKVAVLTSNDSTEQILYKMISTGTQQEKLSDFSVAVAIERLLNFGNTIESIAIKMGRQKQIIQQMLLINKAPEKVKQYIIDGTVAKTTVLRMLQDNKSSDEIIQLIDEAIETKIKENEEILKVDATAKVKKIKVKEADIKAPTAKVLFKQAIEEIEKVEDKSKFSQDKLNLIQFILSNKNFSYEQLLEQLEK